MTAPWSEEELNQIAQMRDTGKSDSYIAGWMKASRKSNVIPPLTDRRTAMPTAKKKASKKAAKKSSKKKVAKKATRKPASKVGRAKGTFKVGDSVTAVPGHDDEFYKKFPRYKAYEIICKEKKMDTAKFVDRIEKLEGVKSRVQALGILNKLIEKGCVTTA